MASNLDEFLRKNSKTSFPLKKATPTIKKTKLTRKFSEDLMCDFMEKHAKSAVANNADELSLYNHHYPFKIWRVCKNLFLRDKEIMIQKYLKQLEEEQELRKRTESQKEKAISEIQERIKNEYLNESVLTAAIEACKTGELAPIEVAHKLGGNTWKIFCQSLPLVQAIERGDVKLAEFLLQCGVDATQGFGYASPLEIISANSSIPREALSKQDQSILELFLSKFKKIPISNDNKMKPVLPAAVPGVAPLPCIGEIRLQGYERPFYEYEMPGAGECAYHAFQFSRETAAKMLLDHAHKEEIRKLAHREIFENILAESNEALRLSLKQDPRTQAIWPLYERYKEALADQKNKKELEEALLTCCHSKPIFEAYVKHYIAVPGNMLTLTHVGTGFLEAMAELFQFDFTIWTGESDTPLDPTRVYNRRDRKGDGRYYNVRFILGVVDNGEGLGHFNLIEFEKDLKIYPVPALVPDLLNQHTEKCGSVPDQHIEQSAAQQLLLALTVGDTLEQALKHSKSVEGAIQSGKLFNKINSPWEADGLSAIFAVHDCAATYFFPKERQGKRYSICRTTLGNGLHEATLKAIKNVLPKEHPVHTWIPEDLCLNVAEFITKEPKWIIQTFKDLLQGKRENFFVPTKLMEELSGLKDKFEKAEDKKAIETEIELFQNNVPKHYFEILAENPALVGSDVDLICLGKLYDIRFEKHSPLGLTVVNPEGNTVIPIYFSEFQQKYHCLIEPVKAPGRESYINHYIEQGVQAVNLPFSTPAMTPVLVALASAILSVSTYDSSPIKSQELIHLIKVAVNKVRKISYQRFSEGQKKFLEAVISEHHKYLLELEAQKKEIEKQSNNFLNSMDVQQEKSKKIQAENLDKIEKYYHDMFEAKVKIYHAFQEELRKAKKKAKRKMLKNVLVTLSVAAVAAIICPPLMASCGLEGVAAEIGEAVLTAAACGAVSGDPVKGAIQGLIPFVLPISAIEQAALEGGGNPLKKYAAGLGGLLISNYIFPKAPSDLLKPLSRPEILEKIRENAMRHFVAKGTEALLSGKKPGPSLLSAGLGAAATFVTGYAYQQGKEMAMQIRQRSIEKPNERVLVYKPSYKPAEETIIEETSGRDMIAYNESEGGLIMGRIREDESSERMGRFTKVNYTYEGEPAQFHNIMSSSDLAWNKLAENNENFLPTSGYRFLAHAFSSLYNDSEPLGLGYERPIKTELMALQKMYAQCQRYDGDAGYYCDYVDARLIKTFFSPTLKLDVEQYNKNHGEQAAQIAFLRSEPLMPLDNVLGEKSISDPCVLFTPSLMKNSNISDKDTEILNMYNRCQAIVEQRAAKERDILYILNRRQKINEQISVGNDNCKPSFQVVDPMSNFSIYSVHIFEGISRGIGGVIDTIAHPWDKFLKPIGSFLGDSAIVAVGSAKDAYPMGTGFYCEEALLAEMIKNQPSIYSDALERFRMRAVNIKDTIRHIKNASGPQLAGIGGELLGGGGAGTLLFKGIKTLALAPFKKSSSIPLFKPTGKPPKPPREFVERTFANNGFPEVAGRFVSMPRFIPRPFALPREFFPDVKPIIVKESSVSPLMFSIGGAFGASTHSVLTQEGRIQAEIESSLNELLGYQTTYQREKAQKEYNEKLIEHEHSKWKARGTFGSPATEPQRDYECKKPI